MTARRLRPSSQQRYCRTREGGRRWHRDSRRWGVARRDTNHIIWVNDSRTTASRTRGGQRPSDFASLAAEQVDLENAINELILRLEDHKYRWELYEFGLDATADPERVRAVIDQLQTAVQKGGPAVLDPLRRALRTSHPEG